MSVIHLDSHRLISNFPESSPTLGAIMDTYRVIWDNQVFMNDSLRLIRSIEVDFIPIDILRGITEFDDLSAFETGGWELSCFGVDRPEGVRDHDQVPYFVSPLG
jgi:hypothetical protein